MTDPRNFSPPSRRDFVRSLGYGAAAWYLLPPALFADLASAGFPEATFGTNSNYVSSRSPIQPTPYVALPLGTVKANGWLLKQLQLQRDGLTGRASELGDWLPALQNSAWTGGRGEDWEKGPYYLKGLVSLAYVLNDDDLKKKAQAWIDPILASSRDDGLFGPTTNNDWWPRILATYLLRDYYEATSDPKVITLLTKYYGYMAKNLPQRPLVSWSKARGGDEIDTVIWLYNRTGDASLIPLAQLLQSQVFDWPHVFANNRFFDDEMLSHNVNTNQALKTPGVTHLLTGKPSVAEAFTQTNGHLLADHGLVTGISSGTEHVAGRSPSEAVETCSVVEKMLSAETNIRIFGDPQWGDGLERLAFNALPAALSDDIHQHVYYTSANHPAAKMTGSGFWQDYGDGFVPAPRSGFPCCCYNFHMGWPKYVQNSWAATHDNGLAVLAYGPTQVTAKVGSGSEITLVQDTNYPFDDTITFKLSTSSPIRFPLELRLPQWCKSPKVTVGGTPISGLQPGTFCRIDRQWANGDVVTVQFPMEIRAVKGYLETLSLERGPIVYSLKMEAQKRILSSHDSGFDQFELSSNTPWNYALEVDPDNPGFSVEVQKSDMPENPFVATTTPVQLSAKAKRLPEWTFARNGVTADDPPYGPVASSEEEETIQLVPFGAQFLRMTQFPYIGTPPTPPDSFKDDFSDQASAEKWGIYGTGWYREKNTLCCRSQQPSKTLVLGTAFTNLDYQCKVSVPSKGNAGLLFRVTKPGFGANDFNGYYVGISAEDHSVILGKSNGQWTELQRAHFKADPDHLYLVRVTAADSKISVYVEDTTTALIELEDPSYTAGAIGLRQAAPSYTIPKFSELSCSTA